MAALNKRASPFAREGRRGGREVKCRAVLEIGGMLPDTKVRKQAARTTGYAVVPLTLHTSLLLRIRPSIECVHKTNGYGTSVVRCSRKRRHRNPSLHVNRSFPLLSRVMHAFPLQRDY